LSACAATLREGAEELGAHARTLAQSAEAADVVRAAQRALHTKDDEGLRAALLRLADDMAAASGDRDANPSLPATLLQLHDALAEATARPIERVDEAQSRARQHR